MSEIKLEVGKTYRNRKGEEVKIVEKSVGLYSYKGSNGGWYAENGRYFYYLEESSNDLIEEVAISDANQNTTAKMKTLKLQVGKTYRSREGEEVKIVRMGNMGWDYWNGNNGEWYYEGGKWSHFAEEHPKDLVEEVPEIRHTFTIANDVKTITIEQVGNRIVLEMVPEEKKEPKPGDVMINNRGSIYIFKRDIDYHRHESYAWLGKDGGIENIFFTGWCLSGRPATPEEAQPLWDALKKAGKRWNAETMQIEDIGPKPGDVMINKFGSVYIFKKVYDDGWHSNFVWVDSNGRAFYSNTATCSPGRLATFEEAKLLFDALKKEGKRWNPKTMEVEEITEFEHIREWAKEYLSGCYYNHERIAEIIEAYLKHKEGKK